MLTALFVVVAATAMARSKLRKLSADAASAERQAICTAAFKAKLANIRSGAKLLNTRASAVVDADALLERKAHLAVLLLEDVHEPLMDVRAFGERIASR